MPTDEERKRAARIEVAAWTIFWVILAAFVVALLLGVYALGRLVF